MGKEKRRFTRIIFDVPAELVFSGIVYKIDKLINLSVGGCQIDVDGDFAVGSTCDIDISLGAEKTVVQIKGEIIRVINKEVSLRFTSISPESLHHLQNIIKYNAVDPEMIEEELLDHPGLV